MERHYDSVHYFVKGLFRGMPETETLSEQREELEVHINDRIADNIAIGLASEEAFSRVIESLGNLDELIETMTGRKKKIYELKINWQKMAVALLYGTIYMIAVGVWFAREDFGWTAVYIALPGWLGYCVPAFFDFIRYRRNPEKTALVPVNSRGDQVNAVIGWAVISAACWIVNLFFLSTNNFLNVVWAWMPMAGLFTWPLMAIVHARLVRAQEPIENEK